MDDPHIAARAMFKELAYPGAEKAAPVMDTPFSLSKTPPSVRHRAPTLGEHTDVIMQELGYDDADIKDLRSKRVI